VVTAHAIDVVVASQTAAVVAIPVAIPVAIAVAVPVSVAVAVAVALTIAVAIALTIAVPVTIPVTIPVTVTVTVTAHHVTGTTQALEPGDALHVLYTRARQGSRLTSTPPLGLAAGRTQDEAEPNGSEQANDRPGHGEPLGVLPNTIR
jgi:hypothetical protein